MDIIFEIHPNFLTYKPKETFYKKYSIKTLISSLINQKKLQLKPLTKDIPLNPNISLQKVLIKPFSKPYFLAYTEL
jgi:hypothetical protein